MDIPKDTLFSLELAVDSLRIVPRTVICRVPAVAFRLLDFSSLLINQLDSVESKQLRDAIRNTWADEKSVPIQLVELKNRHGNYEFKKGKSSLYNYEIESLQSHLDNTPLYVMIVDVWNEVPKLIGHCNISLKDVIHCIKKDVLEFGISVPSVHGTQGKFPIFNLMGSEIGWISLGVRLLSLGGNLIPHIPHAKAKPDTLGDEHLCGADFNVVPSTVPTHSPKVTSNSEDKTKSNDDFINDASRTTCKHAREKISVSTETDFKVHEYDNRKAARQNGQQYHRSQMNSKFVLDEGVDDLYITNTHVPPPLYFNSNNDHREQHNIHSGISAPAAHFNSYGRHSDMKEEVPETESSATSSWFENGKELEVQYVLHPPEIHSTPNVRKVLRNKGKQKSRIPEEKPKHPPQSSEKQQEDVERPVNQLQMENIHRLPILQALLRELSLLSGNDLTFNGQATSIADQVRQTSERERRSKDKENVLPKSKAQPVKPDPSSSKPPAPKTYRHKHKDCARPPSGVPAKKGWLRQQPSVGKNQTKLKFKITNSQKLRLQRHNPEAFRLVEEEERLAEIEFQMRTAQMMTEKMSRPSPRQRHKKNGGPSVHARPSEELDFPQESISTEIARHMDADVPGMSGREDGFMRGTETFKIPNAASAADEAHIDAPSVPVPAMRHLDKGKVPALPTIQDGDVSGTGSEKSIHSISICLPSASLAKKDSEDETSSESESEDESHKAVEVPGFPAEEEEADRETPGPVTPRAGVYSDDFDASYNFASTGEQELASFRSSNASGMYPSDVPAFSGTLDNSVEPEYSDHRSDSDKSSYETAESARSAGSVKSKFVRSIPATKSSSSSTASSKYPPSVLSIPQPQISANSPVPLARRSSVKSVAFNQEGGFHPPRPKPRHSLERAGSSLSNASLRTPDLTMSSSRESSMDNTSALKPDGIDDSQLSDVYSDDFDSDQ